MNRVRVSVVTLAAIAASLLAVLAVAGPAAAKKKPCQVIPKSSLIPHLLTPCNGAVLPEKKAITFTVYDANSVAHQYHPYLNLQLSRKAKHGHLPAETNGDGLFQELSPVKGHPGRWTTVGKTADFPAYWQNHKGTYYVQIQQVDSRASGDVFYSPIVTVHTG